MADSLGRKFVDAVVARDTRALAGLFAPDLDFKALTPRKFWEASTPDEAVEVVLGNWFKESDRIDAVAHVDEGDPVGDTDRVAYRFEVTNDDGPHLVEQQAYYRADDGRIVYLRVVCSGYRPV